ncbi:hypothetical protein ES703_20867 [subsurface metagenome]
MRLFWCSERCPALSTPQPGVHISTLTQFEIGVLLQTTSAEHSGIISVEPVQSRRKVEEPPTALVKGLLELMVRA